MIDYDKGGKLMLRYEMVIEELREIIDEMEMIYELEDEVVALKKIICNEVIDEDDDEKWCPSDEKDRNEL